MIGHLVDGKYQVQRLLGKGGMGAVYEGVHSGTGRRVAIKIINAALEHNADMVRRFHREARAAGTIDTQHIVQVLDTGVDAALGSPFMVMELLDGMDLSQTIERIGPLPPDLALRVVAQACMGLQKAHEAGVVHRDIKPANLFLAKREAGEVIVKVLDFGIAKMRVDDKSGPTAHGLTKTGAMLGSPSYMSPEQAKGLKTTDHRSDIWSLGAVLYEALTGRTPHHDVETLGQLIIAICAEPPRPVQDFASWVPPEVAAVVHGALVLAPEGRFQSATAMLEAIRPLLPQGIAMHEVMLAPMPKEFRTVVQPRLQITATGAPIVTAAGQSALGPTAAPKKAGRAMYLLGALGIVAALGGVLALGFVGAPPAQVAPAPAAESAAAAPEPTISAAPSAAPTETPADTDTRRAKVKLVPDTLPELEVVVDGKPASVEGSSVIVEGKLGSVHAIKVSLGRAERAASVSINQDVSITDKGALPDTIALGALLRLSGAPASKPTGPGPKPTTTAAPPVESAKKLPTNASHEDPDLR